MMDMFLKATSYTKDEVKLWWKKLSESTVGTESERLALIKAFRFSTEKENNMLYIYYTDSIFEAIPVALLFIRHLTISLDNTYYDENSKLLYINHRASLGRDYTNDTIKKIIKFVARNRSKIIMLDHDMQGKPLFVRNY